MNETRISTDITDWTVREESAYKIRLMIVIRV